MTDKSQSLFLILVFLWVGSMTPLFHGSGNAQNRKSGILDRPPPSTVQLKVLDRLLGSWDVNVTLRGPQPGTLTYMETYEWVLDQRFLRGETTRKPDGTRDIYMVTYDAATKNYRVWVFNSQGTSIELPFGTWDERSQSMEWKSGPNWDLSFTGRWTFPDVNTRRWTTTVKDWKGKLLLDFEGSATRRN